MRVDDLEARDIAKAQGAGEPAHPFFRAPLGPDPQTVFGIAHAETMAPFVAIAAKIDHGYKSIPVDPLTETRWNGWEIDAILFRDIDGSKTLCPIVIAEYMTGIGPTGAQPFVQVAVYVWNGKKFAHAVAVEKALDGAKDAAEIDKRLAALKK